MLHVGRGRALLVLGVVWAVCLTSAGCYLNVNCGFAPQLPPQDGRGKNQDTPPKPPTPDGVVNTNFEQPPKTADLPGDTGGDTRRREGDKPDAKGAEQAPQPTPVGPPAHGPNTGNVPPLPREKQMVTHPPYVVEPPDILLISAIRLIPRPPYRIEPLYVLILQVTETLPNQPIAGLYPVQPDGTIALGFTYGVVRVAGLTLEEAQRAVRLHLEQRLKNPQVALGLAQFRDLQQIAGEHLVKAADWSHCAIPPPGALLPDHLPPPGTRRILSEPPMPDSDRPSRPRTEAPPDVQPAPAAGQPETTVPVGVEKSASNEHGSRDGNSSEPPLADKHPAERWMPPASLPPPSLPPLGSEQRLSPTAEPPKAVGPTPQSRRNEGRIGDPSHDETPSPKPSKPAGSEITQASAISTSSSPYAQRPKEINTGPGKKMRMVNSRRIMLDYDLPDIPKPDQTVLDLWYTQDGKTWEKDNTALKTGSPYMVEVNREGKYGFTLVARHIGEKCDPPAPGEPPPVWVEVDWTKPVVHMVGVRPMGDPSARRMSIAWIATDNNLAAQPITLSWAESADGPWYVFASKIENTGRYSWQVPGNVPTRVYLRVEAVDLVHNIGSATTTTPVIIPGGGR